MLTCSFRAARRDSQRRKGTDVVSVRVCRGHRVRRWIV